MRKILCPVDFTEPSKHGMEYASHLAKALEASLSLLYVRSTIWPEATHLKHEENESNESILSWLSIYAREIHTAFNIACDFHLQETTHTFEQSVAELAPRYDLIVMGTNGADNSYQYLFGTHSFQVMHDSKCPVVLVPEGYVYQPIGEIVYAYSPKTNPLFLTEQLRRLAGPLGASVKVLHILEEKPSLETVRKMEILEDVIKAREPRNISWSFDYQYADDVALALDHYMKTDKGGNMLALSFHHRSVIEKLFRENVIKKITMITDYPIFTFWH
jgi:nucleotide-binding universal stress UspA family protein